MRYLRDKICIGSKGATSSYQSASSPLTHTFKGTASPTVPPVRRKGTLDWPGRNVKTGGSTIILGEEKERVTRWGVGYGSATARG